MSWDQSLMKPPSRVLSTLEEDGSRRWLYPRLSLGRFWKWRRFVAYALIALFTLLPFVTINGKPAILLDVVKRQFTLFGYTFLPTDTALLALLLILLILGVFFFTAVLGRVWCGWACPQTVYMEYVYRPIERLFTGRAGKGGAPTASAGWRTVAMYAAFLLVSFYLANTFLAYFVGIERLRAWVMHSPLEHPVGFAIVVVVTGLMMFDFAWFREQTCLIACPYGRLQSVLLDRQSLIISYDPARGEPRGKGKRVPRSSVALPIAPDPAARVADPEAKPAALGDCIDCTLCVQVCPTGIDIRDGLQFECVACAQCIDACNEVMDRIGLPRGLIRYSSQDRLTGKPLRVVRPRVVLYGLVILVLAALLGGMLAGKSPVDVMVLRNVGLPFMVAPDGAVENNVRLKVTNRTDADVAYRIELLDAGGARLINAESAMPAAPGQTAERAVQIVAPRDAFVAGRMRVTLRISGDDGSRIDRRWLLIGPQTSGLGGGGDGR